MISLCIRYYNIYKNYFLNYKRYIEDIFLDFCEDGKFKSDGVSVIINLIVFFNI